MRTNYQLDELLGGWHLPVIRMGKEPNPFYEDGVRMFAVLGYELPYDSMKSLAVLGLLQDAHDKGMLVGKTTIIEATSGATGGVLTGFAPAHPYLANEVVLVMNDDVPLGKRQPAYFGGARIIPPEDGLSGIATARKLGGGGWKPDGAWQKAPNGFLNLDQYANPANAHYYRTWAAPKIMEQTRIDHDPARFVLVCAVGTGGTGIGLGEGIRERSDEAIVVGAQCAPDNEIPGARDVARMKEISLPWEKAFDHFEEVETKMAYLCVLWLNWFRGITAGATGGMTYAATLKFLKKMKDTKSLDEFRDRDGLVKVLIVIHDGWRPYLIDRLPSFVHRDHQNPATAPKPWELL